MRRNERRHVEKVELSLPPVVTAALIDLTRRDGKTSMASPDADLLASLARQLAAENDIEAVWQRVVDTATNQIDGAQHAGITITERKSVSTPVASNDLVRRIDKEQYAIGQGPCLTAALDQHPIVRVDDLGSDQRWPDFGRAAVELGVRSMLSFQLYTGTGADTDSAGDTIGALNIYAANAGAFTDDSVHTGTLLATHAALAAAAQAKTSNLRVALQSRDVIGQAKGILMERFKIADHEAFDLLVAASQHTHKKLRDVADQLTATGELVID